MVTLSPRNWDGTYLCVDRFSYAILIRAELQHFNILDGSNMNMHLLVRIAVYNGPIKVPDEESLYCWEGHGSVAVIVIML